MDKSALAAEASRSESQGARSSRAMPKIIFIEQNGNRREIDDVESFTHKLFGRMQDAGARLGIGRYGEARLIYTTEQFGGGEFRRTFILGPGLRGDAVEGSLSNGVLRLEIPKAVPAKRRVDVATA